MSKTESFQDVVDELKTFAVALKRRPDVEVETASVGKKAGKADLARFAANLPADLRELYAAMNGAHIAWRFIEPPGHGRMRIAPLNEHARFAGDDVSYMNFGDDVESFMLDEIEAEGSTWLVRKKGTTKHRIVFAPTGEGSEAIVVASSLAEYLRKAISHGLVSWWPTSEKSIEEKQIVARFRSTPRAPAKIRAGVRVHFGYFSEGGRGEVLRTHKARESADTRFSGTDFAEVRFDEGTVGWIPVKFMKVAPAAPTAYDRLRAALPDVTDAAAALDDVAKAIGPITSYSEYPSNARVAAAVLRDRSLAEAATFIVDLFDATKAKKIDLEVDRDLKKGDEHDPNLWKRKDWSYPPSAMFEGLVGGLRLAARHKSAESKVPANKLLSKDLVARLSKVPGGEAASQGFAQRDVLAPPDWGPDGELAERVGLAKGTNVYSGTGY